jgi:uncharacterized membrane-anchored protein
MKALVFAAVLAFVTAPATVLSSQTEKQASVDQQMRELSWHKPGSIGKFTDKAEFKVTEGYTFLSAADTDKFLKLTGNMPQGNSYTIASTKTNWFGILRFSPEGYVKDDEKIDPDALLKTLKEGNAAGNEERKKNGYPTMVLEGWFFPPRYDAENKRLEWGTRLRNEDQSLTVNVTTKILGRSGYTSAILVSSPDTLNEDLEDFKKALRNFEYVSGEKYSEWKQGDKVAAYGLGALVVGGAAAVATSKGGLKAIGLAVIAGLAAAWAFIKRLISRKK